MSEELKSNLQILAEYLGCEITEINPDKKMTVADATMLMHLYSAQFKQALAKADEWVSVETGDFVTFECYTETKCITGSGVIIWINEHDCVVETGVRKKKRYQMQVSALKKKLIDLPTPPNQ